ncbi:hypothetical protein [Parapedobacter sp. 2B3]|uniref:hypothetical protein n=1 Tax=Parapedobacter sp. 2B3 TaxID=3342381 RepID=UPI0035B60B11
MGRYFQISRWLLCVVTLGVVVTVVSIPLIATLHTHIQHVDGCDEGHGGDAGTDGASNCDFCALYGQFTPREALSVSMFSFRTPVTPLRAIVAQPRSKVLCEGVAHGYTTRGPPSIFA